DPPRSIALVHGIPPALIHDVSVRFPAVYRSYARGAASPTALLQTIDMSHARSFYLPLAIEKAPGRRGPGASFRRRAGSGARAIADEESVVAVYGDLPPEILIVAEREHLLPPLLEVGI